MNVDRGKANRVTLEAQCARILANVRVCPDEQTLGRPVTCVRCKDLGVIEWVKGEFVSERGKKLVASADSPVFTGCECRRKFAEDKPVSRRYSAA